MVKLLLLVLVMSNPCFYLSPLTLLSFPTVYYHIHCFLQLQLLILHTCDPKK